MVWNMGVHGLHEYYIVDNTGQKRYFIPIIINDDAQQPQPDDSVLCLDELENGWKYAYREHYGEDSTCMGCKKILVMPHQFSPKTLKLIVDRKIREGDNVLVKGKWKCNSEKPDICDLHAHPLGCVLTVELNENNLATIYEEPRIKLSKLKELAVEFAKEWQYGNILTDRGVNKWFHENLSKYL